MNTTVTAGIINAIVDVTAVRFTREFDVIPRRIEFDGRSYDLSEGSVKVDARGMREVNLSDGSHEFYLAETASQSWRLVRIN